MTELVTRNFWWPGVTKEIKKYVEGCNTIMLDSCLGKISSYFHHSNKNNWLKRRV